MRGARIEQAVDVILVGIIPADAGSTRDHWCLVDRSQDHPRGCGEHSSSDVSPCAPIGSSPRMRGARGAGSSTTRMGGIIPADAGSTSPSSWSNHRSRDHPRGCGEHEQQQNKVLQAKGSSPRMRGTPMVNTRPSEEAGIIPADAGSTHGEHQTKRGSGDHPRGCGEH